MEKYNITGETMIKKCPKCKEFDYETMLEKCWACGYEKRIK